MKEEMSGWERDERGREGYGRKAVEEKDTL